MFGICGLEMALLQMQLDQAERQADAEMLAMRLKHALPEEHPRIRREHADAIEKRRQERETERRHRELCQAIRDAGRRSWL